MFRGASSLAAIASTCSKCRKGQYEFCRIGSILPLFQEAKLMTEFPPREPREIDSHCIHDVYGYTKLVMLSYQFVDDWLPKPRNPELR